MYCEVLDLGNSKPGNNTEVGVDEEEKCNKIK